MIQKIQPTGNTFSRQSSRNGFRNYLKTMFSRPPDTLSGAELLTHAERATYTARARWSKGLPDEFNNFTDEDLKSELSNLVLEQAYETNAPHNRSTIEGLVDLWFELGPDSEITALDFEDGAVPITQEQGEIINNFNLGDTGNVHRFIFLFGDRLLWNKSLGWLFYKGGLWLRDGESFVHHMAQKMVLTMVSALKFATGDRAIDLMKFAKSSNKKSRMMAAVDLAACNPRIYQQHVEEFDLDPFLLNVKNGTICLKKGEFKLHKHNPNDLITKICPVKYKADAGCPKWHKFLDEIMDGDKGLVSFLRRAAGYAATGDTSERCLFIQWGTGANGKSVFLEVLTAVLGDYCRPTRPETLMQRHGDSIPNDIACLNGARFVPTSESQEGQRLAEHLIKIFCGGGDKISARFLHKEFFEFKPTFKIFLATNHRPIVRETTNAIWDRIYLIPHNVRFYKDNEDGEPKRITDLAKKIIAEESSGVLNWLIQGCMEWQKEELNPPEAVRDATKEYREDMDVLGGFIGDCCHIDQEFVSGIVHRTQYKASASDLYRTYNQYCESTGEKAISQRAFGLRLQERGLVKDRDSYKRFWEGIGIKKDEQ